MKRFFFAVALVAVASIIVAGTASADAVRNQPAPPSATFTLTSPMAPGDWQGPLWIQDYTVNINPDGTFWGTGHVHNPVNSYTVDENVTGPFNQDYSALATFNADRPGILSWSLTDAKFDGSQTRAVVSPDVPWEVWFKASPPQFSGDTYKNHGDYVSSQGGGKDAAHSPIGMPLLSKSGK